MANLAQLEKRVTALEASATALRADVQKLRADVAALQTSGGSADPRVDALQAAVLELTQRLENLNLPPATGELHWVPPRIRLVGVQRDNVGSANFSVTWTGDPGLTVSMALDDGTPEFVAQGVDFPVQTSVKGQHSIKAWIGEADPAAIAYFVVE
jgi:hypothetical protein